MPKRPILEVRDVAVKRGNKLLWDGVSFSLAPGEALVVAGPNGSGKTSLLHAVSGLLRPVRGSVIIDGVDVYSLGRSKRIAYTARRVAVSFQEPLFLPGLSAGENIVFTLTSLGVEPGEARRLAHEALSLVGIDYTAKPRRLSGGERKRADIARALAKVYAGLSTLLVLDEPTAHLDERWARVVMDEVARLKSEGWVAVVASTVDDPRVLRTADAVLRPAASKPQPAAPA